MISKRMAVHADNVMAQILGINPNAIIRWVVDSEGPGRAVAEVKFRLTPEQIATLEQSWAHENAPSNPGLGDPE